MISNEEQLILTSRSDVLRKIPLSKVTKVYFSFEVIIFKYKVLYLRLVVN